MWAQAPWDTSSTVLAEVEYVDSAPTDITESARPALRWPRAFRPLSTFCRSLSSSVTGPTISMRVRCSFGEGFSFLRAGALSDQNEEQDPYVEPDRPLSAIRCGWAAQGGLVVPAKEPSGGVPANRRAWFNVARQRNSVGLIVATPSSLTRKLSELQARSHSPQNQRLNLGLEACVSKILHPAIGVISEVEPNNIFCLSCEFA